MELEGLKGGFLGQRGFKRYDTTLRGYDHSELYFFKPLKSSLDICFRCFKKSALP